MDLFLPPNDYIHTKSTTVLNNFKLISHSNNNSQYKDS